MFDAERSLLVAWVAGSALLACSPSAGTGKGGNSSPVGTVPTTSSSSGGGGSSGGSSSPPVGGSTGGSGPVIFGQAGSSTMNMPDGSCAAQSASAERIVQTKQIPVTQQVKKPVALYIMLDQSGSMNEPATMGTKWSVVTNGITAFVNDPANAGFDVALGFFPPLFGTNGDCTGAGYDTPVVPMAPLPGNANAITSAFPAGPTGLGTPTEGGLRGAENFCLTYQSQKPDEQCVVVFVTDGQPSMCDTTLMDLINVAGDANSKGVLTFAIGMAGQMTGEVDFDFLDSVAKAGGTDCNPQNPGNEACNIGGGSDFTAAMNAIRKTITQTTYITKTVVQTTALACEFTIPAPPDRQMFDRTKVNVQFTDPQGNADPVYQSQNLADCAKTSGLSWYYDDPMTPTKIELCPNTCSVVNAGRGDGGFISVDAGVAPSVSVLFGCDTIVATAS